ncbi:MAG TPA: hypothetical protein VIV60_00350 [Polyangiaceae bacterium]
MSNQRPPTAIAAKTTVTMGARERFFATLLASAGTGRAGDAEVLRSLSTDRDVGDCAGALTGWAKVVSTAGVGGLTLAVRGADASCAGLGCTTLDGSIEAEEVDSGAPRLARSKFESSIVVGGGVEGCFTVVVSRLGIPAKLGGVAVEASFGFDDAVSAR